MTVEELIAREQIRQSLLRHFRAADRVDAELEERAFWPDGHFIGGPVHGAMAEAIPGLYGGLLGETFETTCHYITNILVTVEGDRGHVECYGVGYHLIADNAETIAGVLGADFPLETGQRYELLVGVRYAVVMERRQGEWRILTMEPVIDWTRAQPHAGIGDAGLAATIAGRGQRNHCDASYFGKDWMP